MSSTLSPVHDPPHHRGPTDRPPFGREALALLGVAGPIVVSQLGSIAMNTTDTLMVGRLGADALAAAGVAGAVHFALLTAAQGVVMGMGPLVSQAWGAGRGEECRRVLVQGMWVAAALSAVAVAVSLPGPWLARLLGQAPEVAAQAGAMLQVLAPGIPAALAFMAFRQYLEGMGVARPAMTITLAGIVLNVFLNWGLIWGIPGVVPPLGLLGSALATSLVRWAMLAGLLLLVARSAALNPFRGIVAAVEPRRIRRIVAIGGPIGAQLGAEVGIFAFAALMMGWLGPVQLAAHQVAINVAATTFMVGLGTSIAGSIRVGQHLGAADPAGARRAAGATYLLVVGFMGLCGLAFVLFPRAIISLYTVDPEILRLGSTLLLLAAAFQLFDAAQVAGLQILRGAADTRVPMWITLAGYWGVGVPVAYLLGFRTTLGHVGIWAGLVVGLAVVALLLAARVRRVMWRA